MTPGTDTLDHNDTRE